MKRVVTITSTWCDYPNCADLDDPEGQQTSAVQFWVYVTAKGRKTHPITVELCDQHRDELKGIFQSMSKHDQKAVD